MYSLSEKAISEKYEDLLFTKVMALYAAEESEKILSEIENEEPADPKNIEKIYSKTERRENLSVFWKVSKKLITVAAMVVFVAVVSLSSVVVASAETREAVAEAIYHLMIKEYDRYTEVSIGNSTGFIDPEIYTWDDAYGMTYVPDGFNLSGVYKHPGQSIIDYSKENEYFSFLQAQEASADVDTENAQIVERIIINNSEGLLVVKNGLTQVVWSEKNIYMTIIGTAPTEEIIKVAEGIKPIGKTEIEEYKFVDPEIYTWDNAYGMTYVPENFIFINSDDLGSSQFLNYRNGEKVLSFIQSTDTSSFVDSENADSIKNIIIGTSEALLITKSDWSCISWTLGNKLLQLSGNVSTEEIIKVAEGIKPIGKTETEEPAEEYEFVDPEHYNYENAYAPTYMIEEFVQTDCSIGTDIKIHIYTFEDKFIYIEQNDITAGSHIDTENAQVVKEIVINGSQALYVEKDGFAYITWSFPDALLFVYGNIDGKEIIKVAEGIKPMN